MADSPCTACGMGFHGKAFIAYVNFYDDRELVQKRLRLCVNCITDHFLILVEKADSRNERGIWIDSRESESWGKDAHLGITETARLAASSLRPLHVDTPTSSRESTEQTKSSAPNATTLSQQQRSQSSEHSGKLASSTKISRSSEQSSRGKSSSESNPKQNGSARGQTKSTGS